jgi:hypothetical protein
MASTLVKVHAFSEMWQDVRRASAAVLQEGKAYTNASAVFAGAVTSNANPSVLEEIADTQTTHPTESHPLSAVRLASLKIDLSSVAADALTVNPIESVVDLISDCEALEEELSATYQFLLAKELGIEPHVDSASDARDVEVDQAVDVVPAANG